MYRYWQRSCGVLPGTGSSSGACGGDDDGGVCAPAGTIAPTVINNMPPSKPRIAIGFSLPSGRSNRRCSDVLRNRHRYCTSLITAMIAPLWCLEQRQFALAASKSAVCKPSRKATGGLHNTMLYVVNPCFRGVDGEQDLDHSPGRTMTVFLKSPGQVSS